MSTSTNVNTQTRDLHDRDLKELDSQISQTISEIKALDFHGQQINHEITQKVQHIAELLEEKFNRAGTPDFISTICSTIIRMFKDADLEHRGDTVLLALPDRYKLLRKSTLHLAEASDKRTEESSITEKKIGEFFHFFNNLPLEDFTVRQMQDFVSDATDALDRLNDHCTANKIKTVNSVESHTWQDDLYKNKPAPVHLEKAPDAITSPNDDAKEWFRLSELAKKMYQARMDYPWKDMSDTYEEANAVRALNNMIEPCVNRKYRYDPRQYNEMMLEAVSQSGTAAASHSGVLCARVINPKTGLPELRKITKEQLDAISLPMYNRMNHMLAFAPLLAPVIKKAYDHFEGYDATYLADRAKEVGPKLQRVK